jgi:hypothetical protein
MGSVPVVSNILDKVILDKSKTFSTVHGPRLPDDPSYLVAFMQGGLPFDVNGALVPDNGSTAVQDVVIDNVRIRYHPLWTDAMRAILAKKIARLEKHVIPEEPDADAASDKEEQEAAVDDVNLELWLRGHAKYESWQIFAACRKRKGINPHSIASAVESLVLDMRVIPEDDLAPYLRKKVPVLNQAA